MKFHRTLVLTLVMAGAPWVALGQGAGLDSIRTAGTASEAVSAYARALGANADPTLAQRAFITRMIELNSPELALEQAREVVQWSNDGQSYAVMAYAEGQNDKIDTAARHVLSAVKYAPNNDFVQTTAGQIVAWYDVREDQADLSEGVRADIEQLRKICDPSRVYSRAYESAKRLLTEGPSDEDTGGMQVNIVGSLEELGTYSGYTTTNVPGIVSYWNQPYLYPGYTLEPWWADYPVAGRWAFPPLRVRDIRRDVRYLRVPGNRGYLLVDGLGATLVPTDPFYWRAPYYSWQRDPWFDYGYGYRHGGGYAYRGWGWGRAYSSPYYGYGMYGSVWDTPGGRPLLNSRLSQRLGYGMAFPGRYRDPTPRHYGGSAPRRISGGGPGVVVRGSGGRGSFGRGPR